MGAITEIRKRMGFDRVMSAEHVKNVSRKNRVPGNQNTGTAKATGDWCPDPDAV